MRISVMLVSLCGILCHSSHAQVVQVAPTFSSTDLYATDKYLIYLKYAWREASRPKDGNTVGMKEKHNEIKKELATHEGKVVRWNLMVVSVDDDKIVAACPEWFYVWKSGQAYPVKSLRHGENEIDLPYKGDWVKSLRTGANITFVGKVKQIEAFNSNGQISICFNSVLAEPFVNPLVVAPVAKPAILPADEKPQKEMPGKNDEILKANAIFEQSRGLARDVLKIAFETEIDRLSQKRINDAVKTEKERFEKNGLLPWSEPMRSYSAIYLKTLATAESELQSSYRSVIDILLKEKKQEQVEKLVADLKAVRSVHVIAKWEHSFSGSSKILSLLSNGKINDPESSATWSLERGRLLVRWPDAKAPGGAWVDTLILSSDGTSYSGQNNRTRPTQITGRYVSEN